MKSIFLFHFQAHKLFILHNRKDNQYLLKKCFYRKIMFYAYLCIEADVFQTS